MFAGASAARELLVYLPLGWLPRALLHLPGSLVIAEIVYRWIARRWGPVRDAGVGTPG